MNNSSTVHGIENKGQHVTVNKPEQPEKEKNNKEKVTTNCKSKKKRKVCLNLIKFYFLQQKYILNLNRYNKIKVGK